MLRTALESDCEAILEVMFSTAMSRESSWWKNTADSLRGKIAQGGGMVAEEDGRLIGCVMHVVDGDSLVMRCLAVRPESGGRGIGQALVRAVEDEARRQGLPQVLLAVSVSNTEVVPWYSRLGYTLSDEPYPHGVPGRPDPVVMTKALVV